MSGGGRSMSGHSGQGGQTERSARSDGSEGLIPDAEKLSAEVGV